jgi:hypothetical protein
VEAEVAKDWAWDSELELGLEMAEQLGEAMAPQRMVPGWVLAWVAWVLPWTDHPSRNQTG